MNLQNVRVVRVSLSEKGGEVGRLPRELDHIEPGHALTWLADLWMGDAS